MVASYGSFMFFYDITEIGSHTFVWEMEKCSTNRKLLLLTQISNLNAIHNIGKWFLKYTEITQGEFSMSAGYVTRGSGG